MLSPFLGFAQDMVGLYTPVKRSNDPQGGSVLYITEDNQWCIMAFGTLMYGNIDKVNDSLYSLSQAKSNRRTLLQMPDCPASYAYRACDTGRAGPSL